MTRAELVTRVATQTHLTKKQTESIVDVFLTSIIEALGKGEKVELRGFGSFRVRHRLARKGRNPKTGDEVSVPAKRMPFFKAGLNLRDLVDHQ
jgi:integration host factor subunit beta